MAAIPTIILVCDDCPKTKRVPANTTITLVVNGVKLEKDVCQPHQKGYTEGAHRPRRGRKVKVNG